MSKKRLTLKQKRFIAHYVKDGNATRAVKNAYPNVKSYGGMRVMGAKLVTNANVQKKIEEVLKEAGLTYELIVGELKKLIQDEDKTQKNRAIRTAAEIMGLIGKSGVVASQVNIGQGLIFTKQEEEELRQIRQKYGV